MQQKPNRVTLLDVAKNAGVSRATASLVLRGSSNISEETKNKVLTSMRQLGYVYDRIAANLRSRTSNTVGLIIMELANPFYSELLIGIHQELDKFGYTVILGTTFDSLKIQQRLLSTLLEQRVGGVILSAVPGSSSESIEQFKRIGIPLVLVGRRLPGAEFDYVGIDNPVGAQIAVEHLIQNGHRRIAFLGGLSQLSSWNGRREGYINALHLAGLEVDPSLIIESPATREGGIGIAGKAFSLSNPPSAAFCYNDAVAIGLMTKMKEMGMIPGKDLAIVGFDDIPWTEIISPKLTTISSAPRLMGVHAAHLLHDRMEGSTLEPQSIVLEPKLILRESSPAKTKIKNPS